MKKNILILLVILSLVSLFAFAQNRQDSREERIKKALQLREELHRRMFQHFFDGSIATDDIFKDMDSLFDHNLSDLGSSLLGSDSQHFEMSWSESKEGRSLVVVPKNKDQKFEINVEQGMVHLKGKVEEKSEYGSTVSQFSQSFSVPRDCDWAKVKIVEKEGKILLLFPYIKDAQLQKKSKKTNPNKEERFPLKPSQGDVEI